jgi:hypothetical protein
MRINVWIAFFFLIALFALTRYLMREDHMEGMCAHNPTANGCEDR